MTGTIYIASKDLLGTGKEHLYLVYDPDGNLADTSDEQIIRGGDIASTDIRIEAGFAIADSQDALSGGATTSSRNYTAIYSGADAAAVWSGLVADAQI